MEQDPSSQLPRPATSPPPIPPVRPQALPPPIVPLHPAAPTALTRRPVRPAPRPPAVFRHIVLLCLRPDQWAQAARYPMHATLFPVTLTLLLACTLLALNAGSNAIATFREFARRYDYRFAPLVFSKGTLSGQATPDHPLPRLNFLLGPFLAYEIIFDPAAQAIPASKDPALMLLFNSHAAILRGGNVQQITNYADITPDDPLHTLLAVPTEPFTFNSAGLATYLRAHRIGLAALIAIPAFLWNLLRHVVWTLLISFLVIPFVQLAAPRLMIPFRVAWRIALALTVPLLVIGTFLELAGTPLSDTFGADIATVIWGAMAAGMAFWAGLLADTMFTPSPPSRSARSRGM